MRTYFLLFALLAQVSFALAQSKTTAPAPEDDTEASILTCLNRKAGIYKTFDEFKRNAPSVGTSEFTVVNRTIKDQTTLGVGMKDLVPTDKSSLSKREIGKKIWGYCQNDSIFIAKRLIEGGAGEEGFVPVTDLGRYAVIILHTKEGSEGAAASGIGYDVHFATLDMKSGLAHVGNVAHVRQILAKDKALLERYNLEADNGKLALTHKTEITVPIIQEYNVKYKIDVN